MCADSLMEVDMSSLLNDMSRETSQIFTVSKYAANGFERFVNFYDEVKFTDFVITACNYRKFYVHSIVLASASDYIHSLVSNNKKYHHIEFLDSETLERVIRFCYTGQIELNSQIIESIVNAAHELRIPHLISISCEFMETTANNENCLQYALIAERFKLRLSTNLAQQFLAQNCAQISKDIAPRNAVHINDAVTSLCQNESEIFENVMKSVESIIGANDALLLDTCQAIYRSFYVAGYMQSFLNGNQTPPLKRQNTFEICETPILPNFSETERSDKGLFIIARSKCEGVEIYAISEGNRTLKMLPKYHINMDKINIDAVKLYAVMDRIYFTYTKDHRLFIKSWNFKRQTMVDVPLPPTIQYLKPRVTNAAGEEFFIAEEKYMTWPCEGYKTTICKFGLESESYKSVEINCSGIKEIIGIGDEVFVFNQKSEVFSISFVGGKRISRGILNHNGIIKAIVYRSNIYVGNFIRSKCTLFVEQFKKKNNQWIIISSICIYTDALNYHIGVTESYLYVFHGKGKVQRYNDVSNQWTAVDLPDNFNQTVLCVSTSPFTCVPNKY